MANKDKQLPVLLDDDLMRYVRERAEREQRSLGSVVRQAVAEAKARDLQQSAA